MVIFNSYVKLPEGTNPYLIMLLFDVTVDDRGRSGRSGPWIAAIPGKWRYLVLLLLVGAEGYPPGPLDPLKKPMALWVSPSTLTVLACHMACYRV